MSDNRISKVQLEHIRKSLIKRDLSILSSVQEHRYLTTKQICRLHFTDNVTETAALRSANRSLARLREAKLLIPLARRIGGVRAGSGSYVWSLGPVGARLLFATDEIKTLRRQREYEPSSVFLEHTLAIAEVHLTLLDVSRHNDISLLDCELEPVCWRTYLGSAGVIQYLKPDLATVTATENFEDHWFFEVDLATEPPARVIRKCRQYIEYRKSGEEQKRTGIFPVVVWITTDEKRRDMLAERIAEELQNEGGIFFVITFDELPRLLTYGPDEYKKTVRKEDE